jgi:EAL domain-containing protein (putative c-di-GMP-specific phosphodiesterase class I)
LANHLIKLIGEPVAVGDANFTSVASAGIAVMGEDGQTARLLIESARSAMLEARRNGATGAQFYSDTLKFRSLARLDMENELRLAIDQNQLALRYCARHDLDSGERIAIHAYLHWPNAVRGEVAAAEFLPIAESTGLAPLLSQWALAQLERDIPILRARGGPPARFSFGALKAHLVSGCLVSDLTALFSRNTVLPADFELRISERTLASLPDPSASLQPLAKLGIAIVIDEFGRGFTSLPRLARLPIHALQLDRRLALSSATDPIARRAAAAAMAVAKALEIKAVAAGVDNEAQRQLMRSLGCLEGLGDAFGGLSRLTPENTAQPRRKARGE